MKPRIKVATARTPDGNDMQLVQHDGNYAIKLNGIELMNSRRHESELALARLGCAALEHHPAPRVLIGGLGMGYTLRQALDVLGPKAEVVVVELLADVVAWNRTYFGELNGSPLNDPRVVIRTGDVVAVIEESKRSFDAILLDIDNGPSAFTDPGNQRLYGRAGLHACRIALRHRGCLAVWSSESDKTFENRMVKVGLQVRRYRAAAYAGGKAASRYIWVASEDAAVLPPGGGEPIAPPKVVVPEARAGDKRDERGARKPRSPRRDYKPMR